MNYLVMECHPAYAIVLDSTGTFKKVANLQYTVGQTLTEVTEMASGSETEEKKVLPFRRILLSAAALAACFLLLVLGIQKFVLTPYGSVRMQINPDVQINVNRMNIVIGVEGLNEDGKTLIRGYSYRWKTVEQVSDALADRAVEMGYLKEGGTIRLTVESEHEKWRAKTESRILIELDFHTGDSITVTAETAPDSDGPAENTVKVPVPPSSSVPDTQAGEKEPPADQSNRTENDEDDEGDDIDDLDDEDDIDDLDDNDEEDDTDSQAEEEEVEDESDEKENEDDEDDPDEDEEEPDPEDD